MALRALLFAVLMSLGVSHTASAETLEVYKSASCGCCGEWADRMEDAGFKVVRHDSDDMNQIKREAGLPPKLASCHTAFYEGYLFEGHVPAGDIRRFLEEKPNARGLAVPGMPAGENVPGMEVEGKRARFASYLIPHSGDDAEVFAIHE